MHCNVYPIFVKFVRLTHSNKELLTYLLKTLLLDIFPAFGLYLPYDAVVSSDVPLYGTLMMLVLQHVVETI